MDCFNQRIKHPEIYKFEFNGNDKLLKNEQEFESNFVKTSKYNPITFIPVACILQFQRLPNVYFLIIAILQTIPQISPLTPITAWAPLAVVIGLSMIRQGIQDYNRYKSDKMMNSQQVILRRGGQFETVTWSDVVVGDICKIEKDQTFPADLLLLYSSQAGGKAGIETASLDGQKNAKPRVSIPQIVQSCKTQQLLSILEGECQVGIPSADLKDFNCVLKLKKNSSQIPSIEKQKQLLYRGAKLRNADYVYGLVVYTGKGTKIMLNSGSAPAKFSQIQTKVNFLLLFIFIFQCILSLVCAIAYGISQNNMTAHWYLDQDSNVGSQSVLIFLTYLVLLNTMIPISLVVSLEIVKFVQGIFIESDKFLYNEAKKRGITVFSSSLNEELGQIQYIFTDKTGTLTCNKMQFKVAIIGDRLYGDLRSLGEGPNDQKYQNIDATMLGYNDKKLQRVMTGQTNMSLQRTHQIKYSNGTVALSFNNYTQLANEYIFGLSVAHECEVEKNKRGQMEYSGQSPDEIALVKAAKNMGYEYIGYDNTYIHVKVNGQVKKYQNSQKFGFTSDRKRMSTIIKDKGILKMYIKGADSYIKERLGKDRNFEQILDSYLDRFAKIGLRTLLVAMKVLTEDQYLQFKSNYNRAANDQERTALVENIQKGFTLIGATVVEDRLQDNVPETLRDMLRANIKVWMLTGDKMETARNIAKSCNLIQPTFTQLQFSSHDYERAITEYKNRENQSINTQLKYLQILRQLQERASNLTSQGNKKAFLIEGDDLKIILKSPQCQRVLSQLAKNCQAVVCCRLSPQQKADVVSLVRTYLNKITLAIGDGANDVTMIKTAHIGIGLFGQEGMGAVQASDYALPQFQGLWRLLLVHGRWNYIRIADMILYFFYKNMLFTIPQFYFAFFCAFSGQSYFDDTYISLFNIVFTSVPLIIRALLEQDVYYIYKSNGERKQKLMKDLPQDYEQKSSLKKLFPKIYYVGQNNQIFNYKKFLLWTLEGSLEGLLICMMSIYVLGGISLNQTGINTDMWLSSITCFSTVIILVTFKLATHTKFWSWLTAFCMFFLSICLYIAYMWISNVISTNTQVQGTMIPIYSTVETYLTVLFCLGILMILDGVIIFSIFHHDFKTGKVSKIRAIIDEDRISDTPYYEEIQLAISQVPTIKH